MSYYYKVTFGNKSDHQSLNVKTDTGPSISGYTAKRIIRKTDTNIPDNVEILSIETINDPEIIKNIDKALTVRVKLNENVNAYVFPDYPVAVTFIRHDANADDSNTVGSCGDKVDVLYVPNNIVNADCNGSAILDLLQQIFMDYKAENPDAEIGDTWNDFANLPTKFLQRYRVKINPVDTMTTIRVNMDDEVEFT